jgi:hypothetical protein
MQSGGSQRRRRRSRGRKLGGGLQGHQPLVKNKKEKRPSGSAAAAG